MIRLLAATAVTALAVLATGPAHAAAPSAVRGSFSYSHSEFTGTESSCTEDAGTCSFGGFTIGATSKTAVNLGSGMCAGTFNATLRIVSSTLGDVYVNGTIALVLGSGRFAGQTTAGGRVVAAALSYSGPKCAVPSILPVPTHISGDFAAVLP